MPISCERGQLSAVPYKETLMASPKTGRSRAPLNLETYRAIKLRLAEGDLQHDIAADLGLNQGRISEVKTGKRGADNDNSPSLL